MGQLLFMRDIDRTNGYWYFPDFDYYLGKMRFTVKSGFPFTSHINEKNTNILHKVQCFINQECNNW